MKYGDCEIHAMMNAIFLAFITTTALSDAVDYSGYKLYKAGPLTSDSPELLRKLVERGYDLSGSGQDNSMNILVAPDQKGEFENMMSDADMNSEVVDLDKAMQREKRDLKNNNSIFEFDHFPRYREMVSWMYKMVSGSKYARMIKIGNSFEGRQITGIRLQSSFDNPVIFIDAGIHAREWAAPVTALYIIKKLIEFEEIFATKATIYVIPCANPDGYEYTHENEKNRYWRKSRSTNNFTSCVGVDINRNFDSYWGGESSNLNALYNYSTFVYGILPTEFGVNFQPCSSTFPGSSAFTEPEAIAIANAILKIKPMMYLTLHSYGPLLLYPWGFTNDLPPNWKELDGLARIASAALSRVNGQNYVIGSSTNILYRASGGSDDWAMEKANVSLVYTMELPQYGTGFVVPVEKIIPMGEETFAAFDVFVRYVCSKAHKRNCH